MPELARADSRSGQDAEALATIHYLQQRILALIAFTSAELRSGLCKDQRPLTDVLTLQYAPP